MSTANVVVRRAIVWLVALAGLLVMIARVDSSAPPRATAAESESQPAAAPAGANRAAADDPAKRAEAALADPAQPAEKPSKAAVAPGSNNINVWELVRAGGPLMWPIGVLSILTLAFAAERMLGLRRRRVAPRALVRGLGNLVNQKGGFDPRQAYRLCQQHPSAAANVVKALLLRVGRPHTELEQVVAEANQREASRLYQNVRWLNLAFTVAPMLGLLGTVQGMILVFFDSVHASAGVNKAEFMAQGIYMKLVCTFAGLSVAIPAVIFSHLFEGRILRLMSEVEDLVAGLLPHMERFEGRVRVSRNPLGSPELEHLRTTAAEDAKPPQPATAPK